MLLNRKIEYLDETVEIYDIHQDALLIDPVNPHFFHNHRFIEEFGLTPNTKLNHCIRNKL